MNRLRSALLVAVLLFSFAPLTGARPAAAAPQNALAGEVLVRLKPGVQLSPLGRAVGPQTTALGARLREAGSFAASPLGAGSDTYRVQVSPGADLGALLERLNATPGVLYAQPNHIYTEFRTTSDPILRQQWALRNIQAPQAWDITTGGEVVIAILDTGVSSSHPDLSGKVLPGYNFFRNNGDASDDNGHGTYTAGVAAAESDNGEGIAGICWGCKILPVKVLGPRGQGDDASVAQGIRWAVDQGARILNLSLGSPEESEVLRDAVRYAYDRNVLLVAASGNGQAEGNVPNYPAAYPEVLAVSATDGSDVTTGFTTTGSYVDIAAPGVGVWSTVWDSQQGDTYSGSNGTSAAAPYVAGAAALVLSLRPELSNAQLAEALMRSADDKGPPGRDNDYGAGRLNVLRAVQLASDPNQNFQPSPQSPAPAPASGAAQFFVPVPAPNDGSVFFPETGHTLRGEFLEYWRRHGGLPIFGLPISEQFMERSDDGREYTVQYFERHRFELHPENQPPYNVLLSRIGPQALTQSGRDWFAFPKGSPSSGCVFFAETGHNLCEPFLSYWRANGLEFDGRRGKTQAESLALFGLPISEPQLETLSNGQTYVVQWFERARFEDHGPSGVLLGLLSAEITRQQGLRP
ncbi:MAG: S8 family peptidase [Roseiflexaceae bacterium]